MTPGEAGPSMTPGDGSSSGPSGGELGRGAPGHGGSTSPSYPVPCVEQQPAPVGAEQQVAPGGAEQQAAQPRAVRRSRQPRAVRGWHPRAMHDRAAAVPQEATADPREAIAGGEPGPAVVLGLALFSAAATWRFSPLLFLAAYARTAADRQPSVPVRPVVKGEAAPAPLLWVVVEAEAAPVALLLAKAAGTPPLLAAKAAGDPPLLTAAVEPAGMLPLLVAAMEAEPAGTLPLLAEVGATHSPPRAVEVEPAGILPLLADTWAVDVRPSPSWAVDAPTPSSWAVDAPTPPSWAVDVQPTPTQAQDVQAPPSGEVLGVGTASVPLVGGGSSLGNAPTSHKCSSNTTLPCCGGGLPSQPPPVAVALVPPPLPEVECGSSRATRGRPRQL
ncbi:UNVERIFIED_CONTAM: hypothetical protein FKN15_061451 [Acipenser sinensis]